MIGLDTNVLVRLLVDDDAEQSGLARELASTVTPAAPAFVPLVVWVETYWVLHRAYGIAPDEVLEVFDELAGRDEVLSENPRAVAHALRAAREGVDFADALIDASAQQAGCEVVASFDQKAQRMLGWSSPETLRG
ncbi:type II toxin-antitoxin system VapC family toxin [Kytococcus sedentarius]|uniref:Ribonuclease VapC n=1 Tax=Kytococcus sedentarius (strain ATCC 14392 / DSM 20547 / JCM 11482 / CCUG 33030 / NBRC 15357 / NCTC 11040 / CCM 314 / 541) TaxID=478801 RepID=C7NG57_KYTSD|nr:type II toxin-antitoxin system VapC family toxin [Kytococcus sedentarius]ACV07466.1 predicted nucleic-acid-binding protein, contains PIN domain [Kytococcus sedentarius DSM 20547]QQB63407.1 type II toxin-antitoxin system VapC family toxin [Kytococcus sedentarius]QRO87148.1 type II toxin-antitoxin system VapC family toxin [Kytococcus sedentarius]STX13684.1 Predicted nucleic-acid-binding protein, contains PIN domain [Kytococcus sedentarius]